MVCAYRRTAISIVHNADIATYDLRARSVDDVAAAGGAGTADICKGDVDAACCPCR